MSFVLDCLVKYLPSPFRDSIFYRCLQHFTIPPGKEIDIQFKTLRTLSLTGVNTDIISKSIYFRGYYEKKLTKLIANKAKSGGILIDVGANIGYFALSFASYNKENTVYAFEPSPRNYDLLAKNISTNNLDDQIKPFRLAVSDTDGELYFDVGPSDQTGWGHISEEPTAEKVQVVTLDSFLYDEGSFIDFIKIDVEGADLKVLLGASKLFASRRIGQVVLEYWNDFFEDAKTPGSEPARVFALLQNGGYYIRKLEKGSYIVSRK